MTRLDTAAELGSQLLAINIHLPCCQQFAARRFQIDSMLEVIRDARDGSSAELTLAANTPIVIAGDANLVFLAQTRDSIATGDIDFESYFGPDFAPDWDGTALEILYSVQTGRRSSVTHPASEGFWPSILDYVYYTDSALDIGNHFIIETAGMTADELAAAGLEATDAADASDHRLHCFDVRPAE